MFKELALRMFKRDGDVLRDDECELGECANEEGGEEIALRL